MNRQTRIDDMEKSRTENARVRQDETNGHSTVYKRNPPQVQKTPDPRTLNMDLSRQQNPRVREDEANRYATVYKVNISQMEADAGLAAQLREQDHKDALLAKQRASEIEQSDAALALRLSEQDDEVDFLAEQRAGELEESFGTLSDLRIV